MVVGFAVTEWSVPWGEGEKGYLQREGDGVSRIRRNRSGVKSQTISNGDNMRLSANSNGSGKKGDG